MTRICLYYKRPPERDRWLPGDRFLRPLVRRVIGRTPRYSGPAKVFVNLCLGLDRLGISYELNLPFDRLLDTDRIGIIGSGRHALQGYARPNPIVAGPGLMTHPSEWPTLCEEYPVAFYLQHSAWANDVYRPYFKDKCRIWPVGIDTQSWQPAAPAAKAFDFLLYDKILWRREELVPGLLDRIKDELARRKLTFVELRYGCYDERRYKDALAKSRAMIFMCEHESQGLACQECLSSDVPVLAWDQGRWLDPNRFAWGDPDVAATSVPYFDARCGLRFRDAEEFVGRLEEFLDLQRDGALQPRVYVLERLTLEKCSSRYLELLDAAPTSIDRPSYTRGRIDVGPPKPVDDDRSEARQ
jgi:hypothetical protein